MTRRNFLRTSAQAATAAAASAAKIAPSADAVILLWMGGGMAQTETFDPKAYTPYAAGIRSDRVLSTFPSIPTAVDGIRLSAGLERIGRVMDRATLIRSHRVGNLGAILHSRHQYHWHTGYVPPQTVAAPHIGSVIAKTLGPRHPDMPAFLDIGQNLEIGGESDGLKAFHTAGFLGAEFGPFLAPYPSEAASAVRPPSHIEAARFENRRRARRELMDRSPVLRDIGPAGHESLDRAMENAYRLLKSPTAQAFDLSLEPQKSRDAYNTGRFGLGCLLARRAVEAGGRFVEVTTEYIPFRNWDTHENGHSRTEELKRQIDAPVAQLVVDLEERGLLDHTLVVIASEFGRDMIVEGKPGTVTGGGPAQPDVITEPKHYGMHRHFTEASSVVLFGGGMKRGFLYGKTADERPCAIVEKPVSIPDLHATIYHALGIPANHGFLVEQRPFYVTEDGKGKAVMELFA